jgi:valyl-tRNA synthetase
MPDLPSAKLTSERFEVGRNFCNKLLNAARFAMMNLEGATFAPRQTEDLADEDRWILSRLASAISAVHSSLEAYNPSSAIASAREFFWSELCDWYLELIKPRLRSTDSAPVAQQVLAVALDQVLRLLHPFVPFITEMLWERLNELAPDRGITAKLDSTELLIHAPWPEIKEDWQDDALEKRFDFLQEATRAIRDIRSKYGIGPNQRLVASIRASGESAAQLDSLKDTLTHIGVLESIDISPDVSRAADAATAIVGDIEIFIAGVVDLEKEKARLEKQRGQLQGRVDGARKKLSNEKFLEKAKPEIVERERGRLGDLEAELGVLEKNLAELG